MLKLVNSRWTYDNKEFHELEAVERRLFAILLSVEIIIRKYNL